MPMTKIVCTIGPASESADIIRAMIESGMNVARLNFSHGSHAGHKEKILVIRSVSDELDRPVAILQDLAGPKIRVGNIPEPGIRLEPGETFALTNQQIEGTRNRISVTYPNLPEEVEEGDRILLSDGSIEVTVREKTDSEIYCKVITGGVLTSHKGLNLPTRTLQVPSLTEKDREDLIFGLENDVDYVALSFVRRAEDILQVREIIRQKKRDVPVIAKIEKHEAIDCIDEIMEAADGIMVARGDLGVEIPLEEVPLIQKMLIQKASALGKPVITATQMLRSMVDSPRPTRAEVTDVANAVLDGTDAVMLSEETATGSYPVEAIRFMVRIAKTAEGHFAHEKYLELSPQKNIPESVAHAACVLADHLKASAIITPTQSGQTAKYISRFRPAQPIIAISASQDVVRQLTLFRGCLPRLMVDTGASDDVIIDRATERALGTGRVSRGDLVVITAGYPIGGKGRTNMVRVKRL
ncbi:MAG: pyruvate kinase [Deltaproteobacteria bacterium]|nr:MAG: pyruvate kinase [Deltaproteobacteria bacterium]